MRSEPLDYDRMLQDALRGVMREALRHAADNGLAGGHHFYISFHTGDPGVELADHLRAEYADEMTIILQHKFWGLEIGDDAFEVTLSFRGANERLRIPYAAVTTFADPSVEFGLQFEGKDEVSVGAKSGAETEPGKAMAPVAEESAPDAAEEKGSGEVVTLDAFREKK